MTFRKSRMINKDFHPIVMVMAEKDNHLLLCQLAKGEYAGYWLLPSMTLENGLQHTAEKVITEKLNTTAETLKMICVSEEKDFSLNQIYRFIFTARLTDEPDCSNENNYFQCRWFSRVAAGEMLEEKDAVPKIGIMAIIQKWANNEELPLFVEFDDNMICPCGSGYGYRGCCGWDLK